MKVYETIEESRDAYKRYVDAHIDAVKEAFIEFGDIIADIIIPDKGIDRNIFIMNVKNNITRHDESKYSNEEFEPYRARFNPCKEDTDTERIKENFDLAWKHHYLHNYHHPEFWFPQFDDTFSIENRMDMSCNALAELICDYISVSVCKGTSLYDWWFKNPSGKEEKSKLLPEWHISIIDKFINENNDKIDEFIKNGQRFRDFINP